MKPDLAVANDFSNDVSILVNATYPEATLLQQYAATFSGAGISLTWTLSEVDEDAEFSVGRSTSPNGPFIQLPSSALSTEHLSFSFIDRDWEPGTTYWYRVEYRTGGERKILFDSGAITTPAMPLTLYQNHPNPFNPSTEIGYYLPSKTRVTVKIYDVSGKRIAEVVSKEQERGLHKAIWNGIDDRGNSVASGIYFYQLTGGKETISKKMVILR
jgi:hypothetical protein